MPFLGLLLSRTGLTLAAVALVVAAIAIQTARLDHAKADLRSARAAQLVVKREDAAKDISTGIAAKAQVAQVEIRWRTQTLIQKVPTYVTRAADADCVVPLGFVQLHDAASAGLPTAAGGPDPAPSGVPLSRVLETDIDNLGVGYDYRSEVIAWRTWYAAQAKAWNK